MSSETTAASWHTSSTGSIDMLFTDPHEVFDAVQDTLGRKWHLRIVYQLLENGPMGFSELKSAIAGVSSKMLSESLTRLEDDGLVDRAVVSDQPVRVNYSLTEQGRALEPVVSALVEWGSEYGPEPEEE